jgi:hypothetical protein
MASKRTHRPIHETMVEEPTHDLNVPSEINIRCKMTFECLIIKKLVELL